MTHLIDTHAHLYSSQFADEHHAMIRRAFEAGVGRLFMPNVDLETVEPMHALERAFPGRCFAMMGLHPCSVAADIDEILPQIEAHLNARGYAAIGETGLDYHWDTTFSEQQRHSLRTHIGWAKRFARPIVLHTRKAFEDTYRLIAEQNDERLTGVFHCFSDGVDEAARVAELGGFYMGIGGNSTYKKSHLPEVIRQVPLDWIVLETDAPYLAPVPRRGRRNESAYLAHTAAFVAQVKAVSVEEVIETTTRNAETLYATALQQHEPAAVGD